MTNNDDYEGKSAEYTFSLMQILRNDPDYVGALSKAREDVKKTKEGLLQKSKEYCEKYQKEIEEGTKLQQKLLTEGKSQGLTEEQIFYGKSFIPTKRTPILNWLFFFMRDEDTHQKSQTPEELLKEYIDRFGSEYEDINDETISMMKGINTDLPTGYDDEDIELEDVLSDNSSEPVEMDTYIYGNLSIAEFKKLKKLKALSKSSNENEAFVAYRKCLELCKKYGLEFDKIPCNIK
jgi:hypothetical protein